MKIKILQCGCGAPEVHHLRAVDHIMVAVALDASLDVGCIRRCHGGFRHRETGADFALEQRLEPLLLLLLVAVAQQRFHVAGVGRRAVEHLRRDG